MTPTAPEERFYVCRLIPPRSTFAQDMTPEERAAMKAHAAYWAENMKTGTVVVFGPVADPAGTWGLGVIRVRDEAHMQQLTSADPAILAGFGARYEILPMVRAITR